MLLRGFPQQHKDNNSHQCSDDQDEDDLKIRKAVGHDDLIPLPLVTGSAWRLRLGLW